MTRRIRVMVLLILASISIRSVRPISRGVARFNLGVRGLEGTVLVTPVDLLFVGTDLITRGVVFRPVILGVVTFVVLLVSLSARAASTFRV